MIPTVAECLSMMAYNLGDKDKKVFIDALLTPAFNQAWMEMVDHMREAGITTVKGTVLYTLPPSTVSLTPATAGIANLGELLSIEERGGSAEQFVPVYRRSPLPVVPPATGSLVYYDVDGGTWKFNGSTQARELRIRYRMSGSPPVSGSTGIDNCLLFLATRGAALAGDPNGLDASRVKALDVSALGPELDGRGGHIQRMLAPLVRELQEEPQQLPDYDISPLAAWSGYPLIE